MNTVARERRGRSKAERHGHRVVAPADQPLGGERDEVGLLLLTNTQARYDSIGTGLMGTWSSREMYISELHNSNISQNPWRGED